MPNDIVNSRLLGMLAHDLRTPLSSVMLHLELLEGAGGLSKDSREDVEHALAGARALADVLSVAVDTLRLAGGALLPEASEHDFGDICRDALARATARGTHAEIRLENETRIAVLCDAGLTSRAIVQLLTAADVVTPPGQSVHVRVRSGDSVLRVEVTDGGVTIPAAVRDQLFHEEGVVEVRAKHRSLSRGIGTVFCRYVAEVHGGRVGVSVPADAPSGRGNTFWMELPLGNNTVPA